MSAELFNPDDWCSNCGIHRVRQDTYSGDPSYVALCPVCADAEDCALCGEPLDPEVRCTHGRELCPEHLAACPECRQDYQDDASTDRWRLM